MYSQLDEEEIILKHAPTSGRLLDIGAYDGRRFSNTLALIERGWSAVCVEADPSCFADLLALHRHNERVSLVCAIAGFQHALRLFHSSSEAVATTEEHNRKVWEKTANFRKIWVPEVPIVDIATGEFDFINIDTEGTSFDILRNVDWRSRKSTLICVEFDEHLSGVRAWASTNNYSVIHVNAINAILKRND